MTAVFITVGAAYGQVNNANTETVGYEELYDEPYAINKLFIQIQPIYGDVYAANVNAGFGLEGTYFHEDKLDFRVHFRKAYARKFDMTREVAEKNSDMQNTPGVLNYYEFGATYHIKDWEESATTKMFLYKKSYKGGRWAAKVPLSIDVPGKVRKIYGGRLGAMIFDTSVDINRVIESQDKTIAEVYDGLPTTLPDEEEGTRTINIFSNMNVAGIYVGGSMSWIRNIAVEFDNNYMSNVDDLIFTTFFDIIFAPSVNVHDIRYADVNYSSEALKVSKLGFRAGIDGKFNRKLAWGYGGEIGYRPGLKSRNFYALIKVSFPVFSSNLENKVQAVAK